MADVELYLDPICPFAWVTSRWLLEAAQSTHTPVTLRQMSLAVLNEGKDLDAKQQQMMQRSRQLGRLFAAVTTKYGADAFARLYDSIGTRIRLRREEITQGGIREALAETGLDESLSETLDDSGLDDEARHAHQASQDALGGTAGSPIIAVDGQGFLDRSSPGCPAVRMACGYSKRCSPPQNPDSRSCSGPTRGRRFSMGRPADV